MPSKKLHIAEEAIPHAGEADCDAFTRPLVGEPVEPSLEHGGLAKLKHERNL